MYLHLRQSIWVSDKVSQSQPIYFNFNQYNIADSVTFSELKKDYPDASSASKF